MAFLARAYGGFTSPWRAEVDPRNGEDAYTALVGEHLSPACTVIEAGCGHGAEALRLAPLVREIVAFDATSEFIDLAVDAARRQRVGNVRFLVADCSPKRNGGRAVLPAADRSVDLVISRRGPSSWIGDARRVVRPGGVLIHLAYMPTPVPDWNAALPAGIRMGPPEPESMPDTVLGRLADAGIALRAAWTFDVPEVFTHPAELYRRLAWSRRRPDTPTYETCRRALADLFADPDHAGRVALRQRRYLWTAVIR
jgi:SAM-dependent methyltransferase